MRKRLFDLTLAIATTLLLSPVLSCIALVIKVRDGGPVFYRQERIGYKGRLFRIWKFRSMRVNADKMGLSITGSNDPRITQTGRWLRKAKLDELPQLFNVIRGEMSFVGPRPEVSKYVKLYTTDQAKVLDLVPGITDLASIEFRDEEQLLSRVADVEQYYIEYCIPKKIELNLQHAAKASIYADVVVVFRTVRALFMR